MIRRSIMVGLGAVLLCAGCTLQPHQAPHLPVGPAGGGVGGVGGDGGSSGIAGSSGSSGSAGNQVEINTATAGNVITLTMTIKNIPLREEDHICVGIRLSNDAPVWVTQLHARIGNGSHHMIVDRYPEEPFGATSCFALLGNDATRMVIAQQTDTTFTLPDGVGFLLQPHQTIAMQIHYINATSGVLDVTGNVELTTAEAAADLADARVVFDGRLDLSLPPHAMTQVDWFALLGSPSAPLHVFALTSHTHQLGVRATISRQAMPFGTGTLLHESLEWSEPPQSNFDPVLVFDGSDGLALHCEYNNTTDTIVGFGTGFRDEMCFMWLYAY